MLISNIEPNDLSQIMKSAEELAKKRKLSPDAIRILLRKVDNDTTLSKLTMFIKRLQDVHGRYGDG